MINTIFLPNFIDSEVEENVQTEEIQLASLINQLQNTNPMSNTETDHSVARNEILTDNEIIRMVIAEDDDDDDVTPVNLVKISHSEAVVALNASLQWAEEQNFEAHENMLLRLLRNRAFELKIGTTAQKISLTLLDTDYVQSLTYVVGAAISMTYITGQPIIFVGTGQTYTDLKSLNPKAVVHALMK
ncbi:hypothetical protein AVEN_69255-1 [Araneus ventricosus]|uniref:SRP54-type proteins GTP-binding domain-containing protein n=1 Tax=Araneus ventricosus TaxID=182803 RepID=A0A4Y2QBS1_ARAVE|nr:hypothetical protein AVEN_69255-1 [Araneus ventricosus]